MGFSSNRWHAYPKQEDSSNPTSNGKVKERKEWPFDQQFCWNACPYKQEWKSISFSLHSYHLHPKISSLCSVAKYSLGITNERVWFRNHHHRANADADADAKGAERRRVVPWRKREEGRRVKKTRFEKAWRWSATRKALILSYMTNTLKSWAAANAIPRKHKNHTTHRGSAPVHKWYYTVFSSSVEIKEISIQAMWIIHYPKKKTCG